MRQPAEFFLEPLLVSLQNTKIRNFDSILTPSSIIITRDFKKGSRLSFDFENSPLEFAPGLRS